MVPESTTYQSKEGPGWHVHIYLFTALSRDGNHAAVPLKLWQKLYMLMLVPFAIHQVKTYIYIYIYIPTNLRPQTSELWYMVRMSLAPMLTGQIVLAQS